MPKPRKPKAGEIITEPLSMDEIERRRNEEILNAKDLGLLNDLPPTLETLPVETRVSAPVELPSMSDFIAAAKNILTAHAQVAKDNGHHSVANTILLTRDSIFALERAVGKRRYWEKF